MVEPEPAHDPHDIEGHLSHDHYVGRIGWLRAAVLGANDGIVSTASLVAGVAAAGTDAIGVLLAGVAGVVAGAMSMAAGEYISVSSQADTEQADLERERLALEQRPEEEMEELAWIYHQRGLDLELAREVARQLHAHDALAAHARDELGISEIAVARPLQAAVSSAVSFTMGGIVPVLAVAAAPDSLEGEVAAASSLLALAGLGVVSALTGGAPLLRSTLRVTFWGGLAMGVTAVAGWLFGISV